MTTTDLHALAAELARARSAIAMREAALDATAREVPFDAAFFHALSPRVPLDTAVIHGFDMPALVASLGDWDRFAVELERLRTYALVHGGVAADHEVFALGTPGHRALAAALLRPQKLACMVIIHLVLRDDVRAGIILGRRRAQTFTDAELGALRLLAPVIALADAAHAALDASATAAMRTTLRCEDQRLTARQRTIVEHVAMGQTNAEIALALALSPNTLRNHLAAIFGRIGAANRADVVRLAVLRGAPRAGVPGAR